jgi:hypothetical protein
MPGNPADVGRAPVDVVGLEVEDLPRGHLRPKQIAGVAVHDALGFPGGARGIEDKEGILGFHAFRRRQLPGLRAQILVVDVPAGLHVVRKYAAAPLRDDHVPDRRTFS